MEVAENVRRGISDADARRAALLRFGGTQRFREETRDACGVVAIDNVARDTRFALPAGTLVIADALELE